MGILDKGHALNQQRAQTQAYKDQVAAYSNKVVEALLPGFAKAKGYGTDLKKAGRQLGIELQATMGGITNSGDPALYGTVDHLVTLPGGGVIQQADMETRVFHGKLYGAAAQLFAQYGGASTEFAASTAGQVDYAAQSKAALDAILATIQGTSAPSINEAESAYLNRKDEVSKLRMRGIGRFIGDQPLSPITSSMTGSLDRKTLGGEDDAT